ncbi:F5/8 type C domain containing protein [Histomonas meleagridis]|uniref:F5/8 type C domain containing protein n=1 Tax=Histomonas meleagridis TaxID=135588 RepID=UPI0035596565|nr:F5/8 type C domain containing protein [Histomonas meleagridis]KAH0803026.1 F5/8 type C domain containing protein [Histomonas meleagridis]
MACLRDEDPIILDGYVLKFEAAPDEINETISKSLFIAFPGPGVTQNTLKLLFGKKFDSIKIFHPVKYNKPGMALVTFVNKDAKVSVMEQFKNSSDFICQSPTYDLETLVFTDDDTDVSHLRYLPSKFKYDHQIENNFLDFEIQFLDHVIKVNSYLAAEFSTKIRNQLINSSHKNSYVSPLTESGPFELIAKALNGHSIQINTGNAIFLYLCARDLEMDQLKEACLQVINDFTDIETVFYFCRELYNHNLDTSKHVNFIIQKFNECIEYPAFKTIPIEIVLKVLNSEELKNLHSELSSWFLDFVKKDEDAQSKLKPFLIKFSEKLDAKMLRSMISKPSSNINDLRLALKNAFLPAQNEKKADHGFHDCPYIPTKSSYGIFSYIKQVFGKPASDIVKVTGTTNLPLILDPQSSESEYYASPPMENMWIQFNLEKHPFTLRSYTLQTVFHDDAPHIRQWCIQGSDDEVNWVDLHRVEKTDALHGCGKSNTWHVDNNTEYKYIRLVQTGPNWHNTYSLVLQTIEFYGNTRLKDKDTTVYQQGREWCGLFNLLYKKFSTNPALNNQVQLTTAADPSNLLNPEWSKSFSVWGSSYSSSMPWVMLDFNQMEVFVTTYKLKTAQGPGYPVSWDLEGSTDGITWTVIDSRTNRSEMGHPFTEYLFSVRKQSSQPFTQLRIKMTEPNSSDLNTFMLSGIEIYGKIRI